jgi:hypothetical protein
MTKVLQMLPAVALCLLGYSEQCVSAVPKAPANYLFLDDGEISAYHSLLDRSDIVGAQRVYSWRSLEPQKGRYDFAAIERDLAAAQALHKKLFVQVQDRFFEPKARYVPDYLLTDPEYDGGLAQQADFAGEGKPVGSGWVAKQWNPNVRARFQALLAALAAEFDGRIEGVNLPETAADLMPAEKRSGFTCDGYFAAEFDNIQYARRAFSYSAVVQYINFWPCEWNNNHDYMSRIFEFAAAQGTGLGGPDVVPFRKGQMLNSYPFVHAYRGKLRLVAMAVQEPTLTYINPRTGKHFTREEIVNFARDYLGADIIFWTTQAPWLQSLSP